MQTNPSSAVVNNIMPVIINVPMKFIREYSSWMVGRRQSL
jgi:hypothetical protein